MTDDAFLADVIENPEDDAPRLIYADWLDEHGQPERAEVIRVQVALAREAPDHPSRGEWLRREAELLSAHGKEWAGPAAVVDGQYRFRRGFVESVQGPLPSLLRVADGLFAKLPLRGLATNRALAS